MKTWLAGLMLVCSIGHASDASTQPDPIPPDPAPPSPVQVQTQLRGLFLDAAREGRTDELAVFIQAHYDLETRDENGYTALILAAYHDHDEAVAQLIAAGADPCGEDRRGNTAMLGAIFKGNLAVARRLLNTACSPDQRNHAGQTPAMYAALFHRQAVLDTLAAKGADFSLKDAANNDAAHLGRGEFGPQR